MIDLVDGGRKVEQHATLADALRAAADRVERNQHVSAITVSYWHVDLTTTLGCVVINR